MGIQLIPKSARKPSQFLDDEAVWVSSAKEEIRQLRKMLFGKFLKGERPLGVLLGAMCAAIAMRICLKLADWAG
jgi:hypothetical protein